MGPLTGEQRPRIRAPWRWSARPSLAQGCPDPAAPHGSAYWGAPASHKRIGEVVGAVESDPFLTWHFFSSAEMPSPGTPSRHVRSREGVALQQRALLAGSIYLKAGTLRVIAGLLAIPIDQRTSGQGRISQ
jgi:hypothetical protein